MRHSTGKRSVNGMKQQSIRTYHQLPGTIRGSSYKEDLGNIAAQRKMSLYQYLSIPTFIRLGIDIKS